MIPVWLVRHDDGREWLTIADSGLAATNFVTNAANIPSCNLTVHAMQIGRAYCVIPNERLFPKNV